ncbi:MAG: choice-of-anchor L domain-containing protein, partial [Kaistella sp.]
MKLSIYSTILLYVLLLLPAINVSSQSISINSDYTPEQLVKEVFFGNSTCITVENIMINGKDFGSGEKSFGYFSRQNSDFDIENGIILSTGLISNAMGPNSYIQSTNDSSWNGDTDLENSLGIGSSSFNATILEFDFVANNTNFVSFEYLFASEQYLLNGTQSQCNYTDGFAFLIRKAGTTDYYNNLAVIPNTSTPIKSNTVRGPGGLCDAINAEYFGQYNGNNSATNFNGQTKVLTAETLVSPGEKYHLKIVIADQGNGLYDSAVFLKAGSFVGKKDLGPDLLIATNNPVCEGSSKILDATTAGATSYQWFKDGAALAGETNPLLEVPGSVSNNGIYGVEVNIGGCILKGNVEVEIQQKPSTNYRTFAFCDENLSGGVPVNFSQLDSQIVLNFNSIYTPKYYLNQQDAQNGTDGTKLKDGWLLTADTTIYARIESALGCNPEFGEILLQIGAKTPLITDAVSDNVCDNDLDGNASVNLKNYHTSFTNSSNVNVTYYNSTQDAKNKVNPISENQIINAS